MALFISEKDGVIEVRAELYSFTETEISWFYYDLQKRLVSSNGRQGDVPDRLMDDASYDWAVKYYVPKISPYSMTAIERMASPETQELINVMREKEAKAKQLALVELFKRQAETQGLSFEQKCAMMFEETGVSVERQPTESQRG